jgi:hypothetical protein
MLMLLMTFPVMARTATMTSSVQEGTRAAVTGATAELLNPTSGQVCTNRVQFDIPGTAFNTGTLGVPTTVRDPRGVQSRLTLVF